MNVTQTYWLDSKDLNIAFIKLDKQCYYPINSFYNNMMMNLTDNINQVNFLFWKEYSLRK